MKVPRIPPTRSPTRSTRIATGPTSEPAAPPGDEPAPGRVLRLLILGGTVFLGRHIVDAALARGHQVTLFNRGHHPDVFPRLEQLVGDRDGDLASLAGRRWDSVVDTSGYVPRVVRAGAERLSSAADHYTFVSSISVYRDFARPYQDEDATLGTLAEPSTEVVDGETYGPLKALCEQAVQAVFTGRALIVRPGLIVGPYDPTDRFTYWPVRLARGGEVLAPGGPDLPVQFVDARDLASWVVRLVERRDAGVYNATGPVGVAESGVETFGTMLDAARAVAATDARITWVDESFLLQAGVKPWMELPLWVPGAEARVANMQRVDSARARAAGLRYRTVAETIGDTLRWARTRPADYAWRAGLTPAREAEVLRAWHAGRAA